MTARAHPTVSASDEVLAHHARRHLADCPADELVERECEHHTTVIIGCGFCGQALFNVFRPGPDCVHATELKNGECPSGPWTEVIG
jgi:hypothetical protein